MRSWKPEYQSGKEETTSNSLLMKDNDEVRAGDIYTDSHY
jgi:hypothetical protein